MRRFKIALLSFGALPIFTNRVFATTAEVMEQENSIDFSKIVLLIVSTILVALILFLGYKMDKNESQEQRKEEVAKKHKKHNLEKVGSSHINEDYTEIVDETATFGTIYPDFKDDFSNLNEMSDFDKTARIESVNLSDFEEEYVEQEIFDKIKELEELENEENNFVKENEEDYNYNENDSSTMVFETSLLQDSKEDVLGEIKGYDFDENDLEEIKEPKEKKYTRKKSIKVEEVVSEKPKRGRKPAVKKEETTKKSTTKKSSSDETSKKTKTTKKATTKKEENKIDTIEKPKRGRKPAVKKEEKIEVVEKTVVEEQPKESIKKEEKAKKVATKKTTTKKKTETVKKTRADSTRRAAAKEAEAIKKRAQEKKATRSATAKKTTNKKTSAKKPSTTITKTRANSVRKEIERMQKK